MFNEKFSPIIRFAVMSDIHLKDEPSAESERFKKGIADAYKIARNGETYKKLDALVLDGDIATSGSEAQMQMAKEIIDNGLDYDETKLIISVASHEYNHENGGVEGALEKLKRIFRLCNKRIQ